MIEGVPFRPDDSAPPDEILPLPGPAVTVEEANVEATRLLRRIRRLEEAATVIVDSQAAQIAEIHEWADGQLEPLRREIDWLTLSLKPWARLLVDADPKGRKSVVLTHGTVGFRQKDSVKAEVDDNEALIAWLLENSWESLVRVKREPNLVEFKRQFGVRNGRYVAPYTTGDGEARTEYEIIPGITAIEGPGETFEVKPK